jgi:hypothetical protein
MTMGLDTYAARMPVDFFDPNLEESEVDENFGCTRRDLWALRRAQRRRERANNGYCVFGSNYFRGKLYVDLVQYVTGVYMYRTWIPPETVKKMAEAFERRDPEEIIRGFKDSSRGTYDHSSTEVADLREFLRVCAKRGLGLVGSW